MAAVHGFEISKPFIESFVINSLAGDVIAIRYSAVTGTHLKFFLPHTHTHTHTHAQRMMCYVSFCRYA